MRRHCLSLSLLFGRPSSATLTYFRKHSVPSAGRQRASTSKLPPLTRLAVSPTSNFTSLRTKPSPQQSTPISLGAPTWDYLTPPAEAFPIFPPRALTLSVVETHFRKLVSLVNDRLIAAGKHVLARLPSVIRSCAQPEMQNEGLS